MVRDWIWRSAIVCIVVLTAFLGMGFPGASAGPSDPAGPPSAYPRGIDPVTEHPASVLKANRHLPLTAFVPQHQIESVTDLSNGAQRISVRLMTWDEYLQQEYHGAVKSYYVDPDRMVWVVKDYHPNGFTHRRGTMKNAMVTHAFDAETGELLNTQVQGEK